MTDDRHAHDQDHGEGAMCPSHERLHRLHERAGHLLRLHMIGLLDDTDLPEADDEVILDTIADNRGFGSWPYQALEAWLSQAFLARSGCYADPAVRATAFPSDRLMVIE
ncbi:hypothetical protein AB0N14_32120 [Streptomyces sp. NPDC051104]|uniref:hypothetical protein n=1 Tax=Streptomyces sp. NPDC051104 TaxID=3155044 RepID=UPI00343B213B